MSALVSSFPVIADGRDASPIIYGLADPREPNRIRYVGQTVQIPEIRLASHMREWLAPKRREWMAELSGAGVRPIMVLLERVADGADLSEREGVWFVALRRAGQADLNTVLPKGATKLAADPFHARRPRETEAL